ncbi:MAG: class I SAM-dependent methyltransferase [Betaproteobacteria bacterium]|nr:class I SAM-dependent methyltransferase [Betaproteobacteria bacterium]
MNDRILDDKVAIDESAVLNFFENRVNKYDDSQPLVSVIYQDNNPALAVARDQFEKNKLLPLLELKPDDSVLDVGCGIGRWADALNGEVARYHGTDLIQGLTDIASRRLAHNPQFTFQALRAQDTRPELLAATPPFSLIIVTGLFIYLNDDDCLTLLTNIPSCCTQGARILMREPVGVERRLTLMNAWSEELKHNYSAIYRTVGEYMSMFTETLFSEDFQLEHSEPLFPAELSNRKETMQHFFILRKGTK